MHLTLSFLAYDISYFTRILLKLGYVQEEWSVQKKLGGGLVEISAIIGPDISSLIKSN